MLTAAHLKFVILGWAGATLFFTPPVLMVSDLGGDKSLAYRSLRHRRAFRSVDPCIATPFKMYSQVPARPWEKSMERRRAARGRRDGFCDL